MPRNDLVEPLHHRLPDDYETNLRASLDEWDAQREATALPRTTEMGLSEWWLAIHAPDFRYAHGLGWLAWDGKRYAPDSLGAVIRTGKKVVRDLYQKLPTIVNPAEQEKFLKFIRRSEKRSVLDAVAWLSSTDPAVRVSATDFDRDPWLFNCENGTLNLKTGELQPHRQEDLITKLAPVQYDPDAKCPRFKKFLSEIMRGDKELITWLQRFLGMSLTGIITEQLFPIFHGGGQNGKNVLLDTVKFIMGPYAGDAPPNLVINQSYTDHPTEIAGLMGLRLVVASESEEGKALRLQLVKRMTGDLTLKGRFMKKDYFEFQREFKLVLLTNNLPVIHEPTLAAWRRLRRVPFNYVVPANKVDKTLTAKLRDEASGILRWLVEGCMAWKEHGLPNVAAIEAATEKYRADSDVFGSFLDERCTEHPNARVSRSSIWAVYSKWVEESKVKYSLTKNSLFERLRGMGYEEANYKEWGKSVRGFKGVGLQDEGTSAEWNGTSRAPVVPPAPVILPEPVDDINDESDGSDEAERRAIMSVEAEQEREANATPDGWSDEDWQAACAVEAPNAN